MRSLRPSLPEGSKRRRDVDSPPQLDLDSSLPPLAPSLRNQLSLRDLKSKCTDNCLHIYFDGACRGNGKNPSLTRSSCGVFLLSYDCSFSLGFPLDCTTNNQAEITGAVRAVEIVEEILRLNTEADIETDVQHQWNPTFIIHGDSDHVISTIKSGRILTYRRSDKYPNSSLWVLLKEKLSLIASKASIGWAWVPRARNAEADELCNAVLDCRAVNHLIVSTAPSSSADLVILINTCLKSLTDRRIPTIRTLPLALAALWKTTLRKLLLSLPTDHFRSLLWLLPRILSRFGSRICSRSDFKVLHNHIMNMQQMEYLVECLNELSIKQSQSVPQPKSTPKHETNLKHKIQTLCSRGLFDKCLTDESIFVADATKAEIAKKLTSLFPSHPLPTPISPKTLKPLEFGTLLHSFNKLKRGKSPGLSGWTRELLMGFFYETPVDLMQPLVELFTPFMSASCADVERKIMKTTILIPFGYVASAKLRPICLMELFTKISILCALRDVPNDPNLEKTGFVQSLKGASGLAVKAIQSALLQGFAVVCADARNAYNEVKRLEGFTYIEKNRQFYEQLIPLLNLLYSEISESIFFDSRGNAKLQICVSSGTRQGCISANLFFTLCCLQTSTKHFPNLVQIVDDSSIICRDLNLSRFDHVCKDFAGAGLDIAGPKLKILFWGDPSTLTVPSSLQHVPIINRSIKLHGGLISPPNALLQDVMNALETWFLKCSQRCKQIGELPTTNQNKVAILRNVTWYYIYHAENFIADLRSDIFTKLDRLHLDSFIKIMGLTTPFDHVRVFSSIEDGGMGLVSWQLLGDFFYARAKSRVEQFTKSLNLRCLPQPIPIGVQSLKYQWTRYHILQSATRLGLRPSPCPRWTNTWPTNSHTRLDDETFDMAVKLLLRCLKPTKIMCPQSGDLSKLTPSDFTLHIMNCVKCSAYQWHLRHEKVVHALLHSLQYYGIHSSLNCKDMPLPDNKKGGPDLKVFSDKLDVIDVTITSGRMSSAFRRKISKYKAFSNATGLKVTPFVMDCDANIFHATREKLKIWTQSIPAYAAISVNVQLALLRGIHLALKQLEVVSQLKVNGQPTEGLITVHDDTEDDAEESENDNDNLELEPEVE